MIGVGASSFSQVSSSSSSSAPACFSAVPVFPLDGTPGTSAGAAEDEGLLVGPGT